MSLFDKKLKRYLKNNCTKEIIRKGELLFKAGKVIDTIYDIQLDEGRSIVEGTENYTVSTHFFLDFSTEIETYCTCPHDWDGVCEHQVAALLALPEFFLRQDESDTIQPVQSDDKRLIDPSLFALIPKFPDSNLVVKMKELQEEKVVFSVVDPYFAWKEDLQLVNITKTNKQWSLSPCCNQSLVGVCQHQQAIILFIARELEGFSFFEKLNELDAARAIALEEFPLEKNVDFDTFFKLSLTQHPLSFRFVPNNPGYFNKEKTIQLLDSLKEMNQTSQQVILPYSGDRRTVFGYGFSFCFKEYRNRKFDVSIRIMEGKLSKDKSKFISSIDICFNDHVHNPVLRKFVTDFQYTKHTFRDSQNPEFEFNQISAYLLKNLDLFSNFLCYQNTEEHVASKDSVTAIRVHSNPLQISFKLSEIGDQFQLQSLYQVGEEQLSFSSDFEIKGGFFVVHENLHYLLPNYASFSMMQVLMETPVFIFNRRDKDAMIQLIREFSKYFSVDLNGCFELEEISLNRPVCEVYLSEQDGFLIIKPEVMYESGQRFNLLLRNEGFQLDSEDQFQVFVRNEEAEDHFLSLLSSFDSDFDPITNFTYFFKNFESVQLNNWMAHFLMFCSNEKMRVFGIKKLKSLRISPFAAQVSIGISSQIDWFEPQIKIQFGDEVVSFQKLRHALEKKENFIELNNGTTGLIPEKWLKKLQAIWRIGDVVDQSIRIRKMKFYWIDQLFDSIDNEAVLTEIEQRKEQLRAFQRIDVIPIPRIVKAKLRNYQKEGFYWLNFLDEFGFGGCLADDMGLGKTVQLIAFLARQKQLDRRISLVVVPKSLLFNWSAELDRFCPNLKYVHHHGSNRDFSSCTKDGIDLILTTYMTVAMDISIIKDFHFNYVVLDESQAIKNPTSKRYKSVCLLNARNRIIATGTPIENNTFDLFAQFNFLNPGFFGSQKAFKENYANEIDGKNDIARANELKQLIHPFLLRRTKKQVAKDLPEKTELILNVEMGDKQRAVYDYYLKEIRNQLLGVIDSDGIQNSKMHILHGMMKLRQICNSPELIDDQVFDCKDSAKMDLLLEQLIPLVKTNKVLVFSQFTSMLALIQARLEAGNIAFSYLDGKTNQRIELVNDFNEREENRVFLISLKAGGTGLNLTSADYVFLVDPWWNPAAEAQAIDRTHRIGQKNHVFAYKMVCTNSIEEKIIQLQDKKKLLSEDLIQAQENFVKKLSRADVEILFS